MPEILIVMAVMTIILVATDSFLSNGVDFYQGTVQSLEVQQQALVGLTRLGSELENSNIDKVSIDGDAIIFPSVLAGDGSRTTSENGNPIWQSFMCFTPLTQPDGDVILVRKQETISPGVPYPPDPLSPPSGGLRTAAYFTSRPATAVVARNLDTITATKSTDAIAIELSVNFSVNRTSDKMTIRIEVYPKN